MSKFRIIGIMEPGRINTRLNGRFTYIDLHSAPDEVLEKLYDTGCPYVELSPEEFIRRNPEAKKIDIRPINPVKNKNLNNS